MTPPLLLEMRFGGRKEDAARQQSKEKKIAASLGVIAILERDELSSWNTPPQYIYIDFRSLYSCASLSSLLFSFSLACMFVYMYTHVFLAC